MSDRPTGAFDLLIAGHAAIDEIIDSTSQTVPRLELGGALCYSALCIRSLGHQPEILTQVGEDFPGEYSESLLSEAGVDVEEWRVKGAKTTRYKIDRSCAERKLWLLSRCGDLTFGDFERVLNRVSPSSSKCLIVNPIAGEVPLHILNKICEKFGRVFVDSQGFTRGFDKNTGRVFMKKGLDVSSLEKVFLLKADFQELCAWTGIRDKKAAIARLSNFVDNLLVTSDDDETELYSHGVLNSRAKPLEVNVGDTTGAGDIMLASFAMRLQETNNLRDALEFATAASSLAVQKSGLRKAILSRDIIMENTQRVRVQL